MASLFLPSQSDPFAGLVIISGWWLKKALPERGDYIAMFPKLFTIGERFFTGERRSMGSATIGQVSFSQSLRFFIR
jgi:hypothetical protein